MRWFLDTEVHEDSSTSKLISIALVSELGEEYCACLLDGRTPLDGGPWVKKDGVHGLPPKGASAWKPRDEIREDIARLLLRDGTPEIWGYSCSYDWVVFCQLFGAITHLPAGMPMFCLDLKQQMLLAGLSLSELPPRAVGSAHEALNDARWTRKAWLWMRDQADRASS